MPYDVTNPANAANAGLGAQVIRELKQGILEGVQLEERADDPATPTLGLRVYDKDGQLTQIDKDGNVRAAGGAVEIYEAYADNTVSTTSSTFSDLANMSITRTFPQNGIIEIAFCASFNNSGIRANAIRLLVNGSRVQQAGFSQGDHANNEAVASLLRARAVTGGEEYEIKVQWATNGSTLYQSRQHIWYGGIGRTLTVKYFPGATGVE